jgi:peptide-methionine (S)-S-oxide reductase
MTASHLPLRLAFVVASLAAASGCAAPGPSGAAPGPSGAAPGPSGAAPGPSGANSQPSAEAVKAAALKPAPPPNEAMPATAPEGLAIATFAGGCFWCMEKPFEQLEGVDAVYSGYTDGHVVNPHYDAVGGGGTGHTEGIRVVFDPKKISYEKLLQVFWLNIDPTQADGQFCDRGNQYRTGIYPHDAAQRAAAEASRDALGKSGKLTGAIVTHIKDATPFYAAETYHQDFYLKKPEHYARYRTGCGRDARLKQLWGDAAAH